MSAFCREQGAKTRALPLIGRLLVHAALTLVRAMLGGASAGTAQDPPRISRRCWFLRAVRVAQKSHYGSEHPEDQRQADSDEPATIRGGVGLYRCHWTHVS